MSSSSIQTTSGQGSTSNNAIRNSSSFLSRHGHKSMSISRRSDSSEPRSPLARPNLARAFTLESVANHHTEQDPAAVIGSIRFVPQIEFSSRVSLSFEPIARSVTDATHLKVGRYNEKSQNRTAITFKSKVVSRMHAEIWCRDGNWYIKDSKSSSGTFVNHIRLSPPGQESKPTILNDGDTIQFGIDFRGGTEEVYRCVRTKLEINRCFQPTNEKFHQEAHKKLRSLTMSSAETSLSAEHNKAKHTQDQDDHISTYTADCCICLFAIAPSQALFVAPCSHPYHFKCIKPLLMHHYPNFSCCICRKYADLEASVEVESEAWIACQAKDVDPRTPTAENDEPVFQPLNVSDDRNIDQSHSPAHTEATNPGPSEVPTTPRARNSQLMASPLPHHTPQDLALELQMTPTNAEGPFLINRALSESQRRT